MSFSQDLEHYRMSEQFQKSAPRLRPRTQRQYNLIRHKKSLLLRQDPQFDTHPSQPGADAHAAEVSGRIVNNVFLDPLKGYHDTRDRFVTSALAGGRGCISIQWHQKWGVCLPFTDPRRVHIQPGQTFLHSPLNGRVIEEVPMRKRDVLQMGAWNVPSDLNPDSWKSDYDTGSGGDSKRADIDGADPTRAEAEDWEEGEEIVTVLKCWYREDPYQRTVRAMRDADLPVDEWHFVDDSVGVRFPFDPANPVPPQSEVTGQPLRLVTAKAEEYSFGEYEDGYLVIVAPFYKGRKPLFEGRWMSGALNPDVTLSAFPYMELVGYRHPLRRTGISDTELTKDVTVMDNSTTRSTFEQISVSGGIVAMLDGAFKDSEGKPFRLSSAPLSIAHTSDRLAIEALKFLQFPGMNPAMPNFRAMLNEQWQFIGTGDFGGQLGPERSKDIAVGTANLLQQSGDLPVQLHAKDLALQEAIGARVVLDFCRGFMGDNAVSWVTDGGELGYAVVRGSDLVPLNVTVRADKEWRQQDVDRVQATAQLLGMVSKLALPPPALAALLLDAGLSPRVTEALVSGMQQAALPSNPQNAASAGGQPLQLVQGGAQ